MKNLPLLPLLFSSLLTTRSLVSAELPITIRTFRFIDGSTLKLATCHGLDIRHSLSRQDGQVEKVNSEKCPAVAYLKLKDTNNENIAVTKCSHVAEYLKKIEKKESK